MSRKCAAVSRSPRCFTIHYKSTTKWGNPPTSITGSAPPGACGHDNDPPSGKVGLATGVFA
eukprot:386567-Prorocentrum_minimum.AAC.2